MPTVSLTLLNNCSLQEFVHWIGPCHEHSPWIAERAAARRPFVDVAGLRAALNDVVANASLEEQLGLICAHPDLVGRAALSGMLTESSTREQAAAGLGQLSLAEIEQFQTHNAAYRDKFGFPFVICARENKKEAILRAFPARLANSRAAEINTALGEIARIASLRLADVVCE